MITRRLFLGAAGTAAGAAALGLRPLAAQGRPFTFCSWGGALSAMEKDAFMDPAEKLFGTQIVNASPTTQAKIKAMAEAKAVEWDLVDVGGRSIFIGRDQGFLEPIDYSLVPNAKTVDKRWVHTHGVYTSTGATLIAWNSKAFPNGKGPQSWKDFWDVKNFPGARGLYKLMYYNYEAAMLAAGVKESEMYPVTPEKAKQAIAKMAEIKPHVNVWWTAGAQPPQLLASGELAMCSVWSGRLFDALKEKAPIDFTWKDGIAWGNAWVVTKGTPYKDLAMKILNSALTEEAQTRLLGIGVYGPVLEAAAKKATPEQARQLVMHPDNLKNMMLLSDEQAGVYMSKYEEDWNKMLLG
ncbi:MAG: ABC transporter substrate-binding protein [Proteobacteria bacterium]|nr:ABC transporter substrate-binding protein [Pseudomonadota bacterium]MBI3497927.1 ABC transporter substrate-binding protein [Pseudomonadota bacterium]